MVVVSECWANSPEGSWSFQNAHIPAVCFPETIQRHTPSYYLQGEIFISFFLFFIFFQTRICADGTAQKTKVRFNGARLGPFFYQSCKLLHGADALSALSGDSSSAVPSCSPQAGLPGGFLHSGSCLKRCQGLGDCLLVTNQ